MKKICLAILILAATGCATKKSFYAAGGSRADGTIEMAYDIALMEKPVVDMNQAEAIATSKCKDWGYEDAQLFGGQSENCYARNGYGSCLRGQMVIKYQCLGNLESPKRKTTATAAAEQSAPIGKWQYQAEQQAFNYECDRPKFVTQGAGIEMYSTICSGMPNTIRCEFGKCAVQ